MIDIKARDILNIPVNQIWNITPSSYMIEFEDGVKTKGNHKSIIFNRYCYILFEYYPNTPIISTCDITSVIGNDVYNADTHIKLLETIFKHICVHNGLTQYNQKDPLLKIEYYIANKIFNEFINKISGYMSTIDAVDFLEVVTNDQIKTIQSEIKPFPDSIDKAYKDTKIALSSISKTNRFIKAYKAKSINENQANQCIGPRGFVTDLDRTVFRQPIVNGFIKGMGSLYELIAESRTAAKSLNASDVHIRTSEYASRRIQLLTMSVTNIVNGDCGSKEYMDIYITPSILENIKGKYYVTEDGDLDYIKGNEKSLVNTIIKVRTTLGCKVNQNDKICSTCLGKISENFDEVSNLGYTMTAFLMEKKSQSILSTKHLTHSVKKSSIKLEGIANKYFYINEDNSIFFNKDLDLEGITIVLPNSRLNKLIDVLNSQHKNIALNKIGELDDIIVKDYKHKHVISDVVNISYKDRSSILTHSLLAYIKSVQLESDARGNFVINMSGYNKEQPLFYNPIKETSIIEFVNKTSNMIENQDMDDPYEKLSTLFNMVTEQFKFNLAVLEVIVYSTTLTNKYNYDYRLGRNSIHRSVGSRSNLFRHRSLSGLLVFEEQLKEILNRPNIVFSNINRPNHPMDVLFHPEKIV